MANIAGIRDQLQTRLATVSGLRAYDVATGAERLPAAIVFPFTTERLTAGGLYRYLFTVEVYAGLSRGLQRAQDQLDGFADPEATNSIEAAIEGDRTLGGTVASVRVDGLQAGSYGFAELNGTSGIPNALIARFPVEVMV